MKKKVQVILSDKYYVPVEAFNSLPENIKSRIISDSKLEVRSSYNCPSFSTYCKFLREAGPSACKKCPASLKILTSYRKTSDWFIFEKGEADYVKMILFNLERFFDIEILDKTVFPKIKEKVSIRWDLMDSEKVQAQKDICKVWMETKNGQIIAPPRFGKTVVAMILSVYSKTRVAIIAHQKELLDQFYNTFIKFTNVSELGSSLVVINPKPKDVENTIFCLYTWQSVKNKKVLKEIRDKFGFVLIDESHKCGSDVYSNVISRFKSKFRAGLTATPKRKDLLHFRTNKLLGKPIAEGGSEQLSCNYTIVETGWVEPSYSRMDARTWNWLWTAKAKVKERNELICDKVKADVASGHKVIIPVRRLSQIPLLKEHFQHYNIAEFHSKTANREKVAKEIREGKYDIVIGIQSMLGLGFDSPKMSSIHFPIHIHNAESFYQVFSRVRTKCEGKKKPFIVLYSDEGSISASFIKKAVNQFKKLKFTEV